MELASQQLDKFGNNEIDELQANADIVAIHDQVEPSLDGITDGEHDIVGELTAPRGPSSPSNGRDPTRGVAGNFTAE